MAGALTLVVCGVVFVWAVHLPHAQQEALGLPTASAVRALAAAFFTLAFFVSPFLPAAARTAWRSSFRAELVAASVVLVIGVLLIATNKAVFTGNYLAQQGMSTNAALAGGRPSLFPAPIWALLRAIAVAAGAALAFVVANATRGALRSRLSANRSAPTLPPEISEKSVVLLFTWLTAAGLVGYGLLSRPPFSTAISGLWPSGRPYYSLRLAPGLAHWPANPSPGGGGAIGPLTPRRPFWP